MLLKNTRSFFQIKEVASLGFLFSTSSLMIGIWAAALPFIIKRLEVSDGELGLLLLFGPMGSLCGVFISGYVFSKVKVGTWLGNGNMLYVVLITMEILAPNKWFFGAALFFRGFISFLNGVAVNTMVGILETKYQRRFMSTSHAMYSVGGGVSAGIAALLYGLKVNSGWQAFLIGGFIVIMILILKKYYLAHDFYVHSKSSFNFPDRTILGLSFICLVIFMTEGCIVDWSSIYLERNLSVPVYLISLGYGGFATAMTLGRLNGDRIIPKIGEKNIVVGGTIIAALGMVLVSLGGSSWAAILGFTITGVGCAGIVPVLFSAAGKIPGVSPVQGFAMITSGGLIGFVAGPSIIGFISESTNLSYGFLFVLFMLLLASTTGWANKWLSAPISTN